MSQFMLLLHEDPKVFSEISPNEIQTIVQEYSAWREKLQTAGRLVDGQKLKDEGGREMSQANGDVSVVDGPYSEAKEVIGGFFIISAADYGEAVDICRDCPHLKYGRRIEIREVDQIDA